MLATANPNPGPTIAPFELPLILLAPAASWPENAGDVVLHNAPTAPLLFPLEPTGPGFVAHARRRKHNRSLSEDERMRQAIDVTASEDVSLEEDEEETPALLASDPLEWKTQDHYAILGLSKLRWKATEDDIRKACELLKRSENSACLPLGASF